jgi:hypothetical protein
MELKRRVTLFGVVAVCASLMMQSSFSALADVSERNPESLRPTKVVTLIPKYGYSSGVIRVRLSHSEVEIVRRLQAASVSATPNSNNSTSNAVFYIEPSALNSETISLGREAMTMAGEILAVPEEVVVNKTFVIIGRSKEFLANTIRSIGCFPDFTSIGGALLMGATICNRQVIVINLSGYLFIKNRSQSLTTEMETWPEPSIAATSYLIVDRNIAGLAHEWTHVSRSYISKGLVADNEPAWFREGLAEVISGMARVRASKNRMTYQDFHVIRIRKFAKWPNSCHGLTRDYRENSQVLGGCEYLRGSIALELLIANYGGVSKVIKLYEDMRLTADFFESFANTYHMSVTDFERRSDIYFKYITQAATYKP